MAANVCWLSLDPVRCKLDYYPRVIAEQIEAAYSSAAEQCVLGADFFNATVHFQNGAAFQTTPGQHFGRGGHKQPGYRTVKRVLKENGTVTIPGKRVHGEWRMCEPGAPEAEVERTFVAEIPEACLVAPGTGAAPTAASIRVWSAEDLASASAPDSGAEPSLVVWQWCRGEPGDSSKVNGVDAITLGDEMWSPHLEETNARIEHGFKANQGAVTVELGRRRLSVLFTTGSTFAIQRDVEQQKERTVRRVVTTRQALREMVGRLQVAHNFAADAATEQLTEGMASLSSGSGSAGQQGAAAVVSSFVCPITQAVMEDPVMTADGHTYERAAIEQWLASHNTSPLTGLPLPTHELVPNEQLARQIQAAAQSG